jgi:predicted GIY-YIG superfamily endonuclease
MNVFVYILHLSNNKFYTGITKDIQRRIREHHEGKSISTRNYRPFNVCYINNYESYQTARKYEVWIKSIGAFKFMQHQRFGQPSPPLLKNYPMTKHFKKDNINIRSISFPQL